MSPSRSPSLIPFTLVLVGACSASEEASAPASADALPAAVAPAPKDEPVPPAAAPGELAFAPQDGWITETPTSSMRKAQFRLPGADGAADASLVVYYFGPGGGGGVEANLARWAGQFEQPDGSDSSALLTSTKRDLRGLPVTDVQLGGTYVAETSPGSGVRVREEGWRLRASILETSEGAYYVKLVGPAATVARWEKSYEGFLDGTR